MRPAVGILALLFAVAGVSGCSGIGHRDSLHLPTAMVPDASKVTIAVRPFDVADIAKLKPADRQLKDFEQYYFASRLVDTLGRSPVVAGAYLAPADTPSVDCIVHGVIERSDGEQTKLKVTVARIGQSERPSAETFSVDLASKDFKTPDDDPGQILWNRVANTILDTMAALTDKDRTEMMVARAHEYIGSDGPRVAPLVKQAAKIERESLLAPITQLAVTQARAASPAYVAWQRETTKLAEKSREEKTVATIGMIVSVASAAATGYAEGRAGGATPMSMQTRQSSQELMTTSVGELAKAGVIDDTIREMHSAFASNVAELKVTFDEQVYTLTGSPDQQMTQFHGIVRQRLQTFASRS